MLLKNIFVKFKTQMKNVNCSFKCSQRTISFICNYVQCTNVHPRNYFFLITTMKFKFENCLCRTFEWSSGTSSGIVIWKPLILILDSAYPTVRTLASIFTSFQALIRRQLIWWSHIHLTQDPTVSTLSTMSW